VADRKDVAVCITSEEMDPCFWGLQFALGDDTVSMRALLPCKRCWRPGPCPDAELWLVKGMVSTFKLPLLSQEFPTAGLWPFRSCVFFAVIGRLMVAHGSFLAMPQKAEP
jgi:hypothetical protein